MKKYNVVTIILVLLFLLAGLYPVSVINAKVSVSKEKAIKLIYPKANNDPKKEVITKKLTTAQKNAIKKEHKMRVKTSHKIYPCKKGSKLLGRVFLVSEKGKHGLIMVAVGVNKDGKVKDAVVCSLKEVRGKPVTSKMFLRQFRKKSLKDKFEVGKDVQGVTKATMSSEGVSKAVKKALILADTFF